MSRSQLNLSRMSKYDLLSWGAVLGLELDPEADKETLICAFRAFADKNLGNSIPLYSELDDAEASLTARYADLRVKDLRQAAKKLGLTNYSRQKAAVLRRRLVTEELKRAA